MNYNAICYKKVDFVEKFLRFLILDKLGCVSA